MKPTKANLDCAELILHRYRLDSKLWNGLKKDIAIALTLAEKEVKNKLTKNAKD